MFCRNPDPDHGLDASGDYNDSVPYLRCLLRLQFPHSLYGVMEQVFMTGMPRLQDSESGKVEVT